LIHSRPGSHRAGPGRQCCLAAIELRAARELAAAGGHLARSPSPFHPSAGSPSLHSGDPSPSTSTAAGSPVFAPASPGARLPLRRAASTASAPNGSAPRALARPREADTRVRTDRRRPRCRGADPGRRRQHRNRHRLAEHPRPPSRAHRAAGLRPHARRRSSTPLRFRKLPFHSGSRRAMVHRRRPRPPGCRHLHGGTAFVHGRRVYVKLGSELDGMRMADLSTPTRVIAITRPGKPVLLHPRRDTRLRATDTAYLVGPYRELLDTLGKGQSASRTSAEGSGRRTP
jgi:hypothetical protein